MQIINRGIVGNRHKGGRKKLFSVTYLLVGIGLAGLLIWGIQNNIGSVGGVAIFLVMWVLAIDDANFSYILA